MFGDRFSSSTSCSRWVHETEPDRPDQSLTCCFLKVATHPNQEFDQRAFKFCFVRNPYDRAVSLYFYLKKIGDVHHKLSFKGFVRVLQNRAIPEIGLYNRQELSQCNSQVRWLKNRKRELLVDFIGRFENIEKDFKKLCSELGTKGQLPHVNRTEHTHYKNYYDDETKRIIANIYAEDLEQFSYAF